MKNDIKDYINLAYTMEIVKNDDDTFFVSIKELPGCMTEGDSLKEAFEMIEDAKRAWIETALETGQKIPLPINMKEKKYSGKFILRTSPFMHERLVENAEKNNLSLNSYINELISENNAIIETQNRMIEVLSQKLYEKGPRVWGKTVHSEICIEKGIPQMCNDSVIRLEEKNKRVIQYG